MKLTNNSLYLNPRNPAGNAAKLRQGGKRPGISSYVHVNGTGYDSLKAPAKLSYNSNNSIFKLGGQSAGNIRPPQLMDYRKLTNPLSSDAHLASML